MSTRDDQDFGSWAGAYALHALTPDERARYEEHLRGSEDARAEAAEFGDTAALLGAAAEPVAPSAALRANLLAAIADAPQLPAAEGPVEAEPLPATIPAPESAAPGGAVLAPAAGSKAARRWSRPVALLAAAAAVVVIGAGIAGGTGLLNPQSEQQRTIAAIEAAGDAQRIEATTTEGDAVSVLWSDELASAAVIGDALPALDDEQIYQLWMIRDDGAVPAGLMSAEDGSAVIDGELHDGDIIGITVEPAGGSEAPTSTPILVQAT